MCKKVQWSANLRALIIAFLTVFFFQSWLAGISIHVVTRQNSSFITNNMYMNEPNNTVVIYLQGALHNTAILSSNIILTNMPATANALASLRRKTSDRLQVFGQFFGGNWKFEMDSFDWMGSKRRDNNNASRILLWIMTVEQLFQIRYSSTKRQRMGPHKQWFFFMILPTMYGFITQGLEPYSDELMNLNKTVNAFSVFLFLIQILLIVCTFYIDELNHKLTHLTVLGGYQNVRTIPLLEMSLLKFNLFTFFILMVKLYGSLFFFAYTGDQAEKDFYMLLGWALLFSSLAFTIFFLAFALIWSTPSKKQSIYPQPHVPLTLGYVNDFDGGDVHHNRMWDENTV
uniref:DUF3533 domain-containing protein n=1 Tax=Rhabditophanes sp. KR3021 TaxID=114890 RepID=A0AC35TZP6_9BILA